MTTPYHIYHELRYSYEATETMMCFLTTYLFSCMTCSTSHSEYLSSLGNIRLFAYGYWYVAFTFTFHTHLNSENKKKKSVTQSRQTDNVMLWEYSTGNISIARIFHFTTSHTFNTVHQNYKSLIDHTTLCCHMYEQNDARKTQ